MSKESHPKHLKSMVWLLTAASFLLAGCSLGSPRGGKALSKKPRVLIVGDSLTVGGFGASLEDIFIKAFGTDKVEVYGCCGASVEHYLKDHPVFTCKCGYRETTKRTKVLDNWQNGRKPRAFPTPKLATLLTKHRPEVVIVQLGTNNFDTLVKKGASCMAQQQEYFDRLASEMVTSTGTVKRAIWVTPPDSTEYPAHIEKAVDNMIVKAAKKHGIYVIHSSKHTRYVMGKSGTDGIHYHTKPAEEWAKKVRLELNRILFGSRSSNVIRVTPPSNR
ncbi:MAG: SGNH/GDSL hydrolase family protein [Akkermansiaceae bacterium]